MKILHIATGFPLSYPGGITNYVRALVRAQADLEDDVYVLARPEPGPATFDHITLVTYTPSRVIPFTLGTVDNDPSSDQVTDLIRTGDFDLIHFHMVLDMPLRWLREFPKLGVPYIVSLHDYFYVCPRIFMIDHEMEICRKVDLAKCRTCIGLLDQIDLLNRGARKLGFQLPRIPSSETERRMETMRVFLQNANLLLPVSNRTAEIYRQLMPSARFRVEQIGNESALSEPAVKTTSTKIRMTAIGTLNKMKGGGVLEKLIKNVRSSNVEFHFYGRAYEGYDQRLRDLGLVCHGSYTPTDLPTIMSNTDVGLVLPIWEDAGPQVTMEFINNRIPVLGTIRGGIPEIVPEGAGFLFEPDDLEDLAKAVAWIENLDRLKIERISSQINRLKTPLEHAQTVSAIYRETLGRPQARTK